MSTLTTAFAEQQRSHIETNIQRIHLDAPDPKMCFDLDVSHIHSNLYLQVEVENRSHVTFRLSFPEPNPAFEIMNIRVLPETQVRRGQIDFFYDLKIGALNGVIGGDMESTLAKTLGGAYLTALSQHFFDTQKETLSTNFIQFMDSE